MKSPTAVTRSGSQHGPYICPCGPWGHNPEMKEHLPRLAPACAQWTNPKRNWELESSILKLFYTLACFCKPMNLPFSNKDQTLLSSPKSWRRLFVFLVHLNIYQWCLLKIWVKKTADLRYAKDNSPEKQKWILSLSFSLQMPLERWPWGSSIFKLAWSPERLKEGGGGEDGKGEGPAWGGKARAISWALLLLGSTLMIFWLGWSPRGTWNQL